MAYKPESKYPSRRAYVVKFTHEAGPAALAGRLENLVTGTRREFLSGGELLECIERDLAAICHEPPVGRQLPGEIAS